MATKAKDSNGTPKKEKKVTLSSNSHHPTTHKQSNLKSATASSTAKDKSCNSAPNYLRPTFSSKSESLNPVRKTINEDAAQKLLRRRSFDRPPSAARTQKSLISPDPKERLASRDRQLPNRSSSFTASKTPSSTKPVLERSSRSFKPVKSQPSAAGNVKKSSNLSRTSNLSKTGSNASRSPKVQNSRGSTQTSDLKNEQKRCEESTVQEHEETANVERVVEVPSDTPKAETKEDKDVVQDTQVNDREDEKVKSPAVSTVVSKAAQVEDVEPEFQEDENKHEGEKNHRSDSHPEEGIADGAKVESDEDKGEEEEDEIVKVACTSEEPIDEKEEEKTDQGNENERSEELKSKEGEEVEEGVEGEGNEEVANATQKQQGEQGKKEAPAAYNDVIEETKNKLLEKRKNKVKALVGAFETVIDYETAGSNK
ncbi:myb-like protein X [Manihot esculenta]|uniref:Calmodulin-binding domain-containing protein n=1 Tax=Manihot esculenta TaxID=3983 RepID=A0A2C9UBG8_MANES|nr:myb-like protein X [Manihot esculenta]OAY27570.1 hypothetical protein MANES_16G135600v8 [Manihot esculenta]